MIKTLTQIQVIPIPTINYKTDNLDEFLCILPRRAKIHKAYTDQKKVKQVKCMSYHTEVSSNFSSSASLYVIRYSHIALIIRSWIGSSGFHSGTRGRSTESITCFPVSNILDAEIPFISEMFGRDSRISMALPPRGPGIST
jgi:hypothetical protein